MGKHTFKTALNFEQVEAGSAEDNVLVRTAEGDVKEVARSEFSSGGTQDLQKTIENGGEAVLTNATSESEAGLYIHSDDIDSRVSLYSQSNNTSIDSLGEINTINGKIQISQQKVSTGAVTAVEFEEPIGMGDAGGVLKFPAKSAGAYILATLDDITGGNQDLQSVLDNGKSASYDDGVNIFEALSGEPYSRKFNVEVNDTIGNFTQLSLVANQISLTNTSIPEGGITGNLNISDGRLFLIQSNNEGGQTNLGFIDPISYSNINFPAKPPGTYTLATTDDIKIGTIAPTSTSDIGEAKEIRVADGYIYWYVVGTGWLRSAGSTF